MKIAILHFHLRRGGVTSVMLRQASCLSLSSASSEVAFVAGSAPDQAVSAPVFVVPELDYDSFSGIASFDLAKGAADLAKAIARAIKRAFPSGCDILHVHNPLLCKNARLLGALRILQDRGQTLFLQIHDLAEDFRPPVYEGVWPYPHSCDYAVINSRDRDRLVASGLEPAHVHLLPNPVAQEEFSPRGSWESEGERGRKIALYPVRAIRRKNIGEALLLSRFLPTGAELVVTLPPTSRGDLARLQTWVAKAFEGRYRLRFNAGLAASLSHLYDQAFCVVTTSVKEGFGYAYLDPLVRGIPVLGREIPSLIQDFAGFGVTFSGLYSEIRIPRAALPSAQLRKAVGDALATFRLAYRPAFGPDQGAVLENLLASLGKRFEADSLDFGSLNEDLQRIVLDRMDGEPDFAREVARNNPFLERFFGQSPAPGQPIRDRESVLRNYSEKAYGERLVAAYAQAASQTAKGKIDKAVLLAQYLKPDSFFLVAS